jgi:ribosomal-protein-alanine N-acetyltransferase
MAPESVIGFVRLTEVPLPDVIAVLNEPRNARHMPLSGSFSSESAAEWVRGKDEQWDRHGYGPWAVLINVEYAGRGGFQHEASGAEIARAALDRGFNELGLDAVIIALPHTQKPARVLARFGFVPDGELTYNYAQFRQYRLTRDRWESKPPKADGC